MNAVCESGVQALSKSQLGSMIGAADPNNPIMVGIAAYVAKNVVDGNRAAQEWLLDWEEVELVERSDKVVGMQTHIGLTKKDRKQKGAVKNTPCPSDCTGEIVYDKDGCFDAAAMRPVHLLQYLRVLWADQLQVEPKDVKGPLWSDFARFEDTPKGMTLVTIDDNSPAYAYKDMPKIQFKVMVTFKTTSAKTRRLLLSTYSAVVLLVYMYSPKGNPQPRRENLPNTIPVSYHFPPRTSLKKGADSGSHGPSEEWSRA